MPSKSEKQRRKALLNDLAKKDNESFLRSLPMNKELFQELFDYLDGNLDEGCDHSMRMTLAFLRQKQITNIETVVHWLNDHGGYCDCEVLGNVEEAFQ